MKQYVNDADAPIFTDPATGEKWRRLGHCNGCGECCKSGNPFTGLPGACPLFEQVDADHGRCTQYNDSNHYYTIACKIWPTEPDHIRPYPSCSFRFEKVAANGN